MTAELKKIWDELKIEAENRVGPPSMDFLNRLDAAREPERQLLKAFERERDHQPFTSSAPCPVCDIGTVTYKYRAPLIGNMKCDTCEYVKTNL
jgi:hypothetical protein